MKKEQLKKAVPSLIYLALAAIFFAQTFSIQQSTSGTMGAITPRTVPRVIIGCFALCAILNMINDMKRQEEVKPYVNKPLKYLITAMAFLFIAQSIKKLGFVICGIIFLFVLFMVLEDEAVTKKIIVRNLVLAFVFSIVFCYGFRYGLKVRIPMYPRF
jgi:ABC-type uncharacterized transport system permease subunit